jgi:hypothetical protein
MQDRHIGMKRPTLAKVQFPGERLRICDHEARPPGDQAASRRLPILSISKGRPSLRFDTASKMLTWHLYLCTNLVRLDVQPGIKDQHAQKEAPVREPAEGQSNGVIIP